MRFAVLHTTRTRSITALSARTTCRHSNRLYNHASGGPCTCAKLAARKTARHAKETSAKLAAAAPAKLAARSMLSPASNLLEARCAAARAARRLHALAGRRRRQAAAAAAAVGTSVLTQTQLRTIFCTPTLVSICKRNKWIQSLSVNRAFSQPLRTNHKNGRENNILIELAVIV